MHRAHLDDSLAEEIIRFSGEFLPHLGLEVVILVPDSHFDPVRRIVALAASKFCKFPFNLFQFTSFYYLQVKSLVPDGVELLRHGPCPLLDFANLNGHVRIGSAALVLGNQSLSAYH